MTDVQINQKCYITIFSLCLNIYVYIQFFSLRTSKLYQKKGREYLYTFCLSYHWCKIVVTKVHRPHWQPLCLMKMALLLLCGLELLLFSYFLLWFGSIRVSVLYWCGRRYHCVIWMYCLLHFLEKPTCLLMRFLWPRLHKSDNTLLTVMTVLQSKK